MKVGNRYYVRIDYKIDGPERSQKDFEDHVRYLEKLAKERFFKAGGFKGSMGGMILFTARDLEEADLICRKDPIIEKGCFGYHLYEWELLLASS